MRTIPAAQPKQIPYSLVFDILKRRAEAGVKLADLSRPLMGRLAYILEGDEQLDPFLRALRELQSACEVRT